jgi:hypothetical protein
MVVGCFERTYIQTIKIKFAKKSKNLTTQSRVVQSDGIESATRLVLVARAAVSGAQVF